MAEQRRSSFNNVYKFNGKELDPETGLYYYGARYYNPRISNWLSVDPIALWQPVQETEHYILGQHNGGYFNPKNMSVYGYTYQNPIVYIDPNGKQSYSSVLSGKLSGLDTMFETKINEIVDYVFSSEGAQTVLDIGGLIPVVGEPIDGINAAWYAFEGDYVSAGLSVGAMVPFAGWASTGVKASVRALKLSDNVLHGASGLIYKLGIKEGNRLSHVFAHKTDDLSKEYHGVWNMSEGGIVETLDNVWNHIKKNDIKGVSQGNGNTVYDRPMAGQVGTQGGKKGNGESLNSVRLVVEDGTSNVITAFPTK